MTADRPRWASEKIIGCNHIAWGSVAGCPYCGTVNDMVPKAVHREEVAEALAADPPVSGEPPYRGINEGTANPDEFPAYRPPVSGEPPDLNLHGYTCAYCTGDGGTYRLSWSHREGFDYHMRMRHYGLPYEYQPMWRATPRADAPPPLDVIEDIIMSEPWWPRPGAIRRRSVMEKIRARLAEQEGEER